MKPILLAGETFFVTSTVAKGYDVGSSASLANGATRFIAALASLGINVSQIGGERCEAEFPRTVEALQAFSAVVLSDVGALSLLLTPETRQGLAGINRLDVLRQWVHAGGGLMMAGGYTSFQGMDGMARFHDTPLEDCLPVECLPYPDGLEAPEGLNPEIVDNGHPILSGLPSQWPSILGMNKVIARVEPDGQVLVTSRYRGHDHPLLAVRDYGQGRTLAWTTDIGPHWLSQAFLNWDGYDAIITRMVRWVGRDL
ncbi:glutamine amidotransferase [Mesorhizobium sp. INR15]|uniref:glutamine amidotransferase n=1 Tax=Mesorhizobium sp. INR15 TaxID=2654248 RepID=UPI0018C0F455|nr:glutamine amidotransferase [Mesorhizobium sp. INR15]QPC95463.1 hypothetical protein GA829_33185 [Mesorhizobium sp. INR15]